jgi:hypothetical protein
MAYALAEADLREALPGLGHECYLEAASLFAAAVRPFLLAQR